MTRLHIYLAVLVLASVAPLASAQNSAAQYWVVVGSYRDIGNAEVAAAKAGEQVAEQFSTAIAETSSGRFHRVLAGPYLSRDLADSTLASVRSAGFATAWVLKNAAGNMQTTPMANSGRSTDYLESYSTVSADSYSSGSITDSALQTRAALQAGEVAERKVPVEPVTKPPPGYQLHRLRRNNVEDVE